MTTLATPNLSVGTPDVMTQDQMAKIADWQTQNKGFPMVPKYSALKGLEEMLELCFASGSTMVEIEQVVNSESLKALNRNEAGGIPQYSKAVEELGDVQVCLAVFAYHNNISIHDTVQDTLERIQSRSWTPDQFGILRRPKS